MMLITWDDRKNETNFTKHGVWFEEAQTILYDPFVFSNGNDHSSGTRMEYLEASDQHRLIYMVTVEKKDDEIRIISARKATLNERRRYEEGI